MKKVRISDEEFGKTVKTYRNAKGLTQAELAEEAGLSVPTVSLLEAGKHKGRESTRRKLIAFLEIPEMPSTTYAESEMQITTQTGSISHSAIHKHNLPIFVMVGESNVKIEPSLKEDIKRLIYWTFATDILTRQDIEELLTKTS